MAGMQMQQSMAAGQQRSGGMGGFLGRSGMPMGNRLPQSQLMAGGAVRPQGGAQHAAYTRAARNLPSNVMFKLSSVEKDPFFPLYFRMSVDSVTLLL